MTAVVLRPAAVADLLDAHAGYRDVRRAVVRGFPYVIFYRHPLDRIDVLRVLHAAKSDADRPPDEPRG